MLKTKMKIKTSNLALYEFACQKMDAGEVMEFLGKSWLVDFTEYSHDYNGIKCEIKLVEVLKP